ncbi:MAG TPA: type I methionyl aminopeptidase [Phycisphaerales bacterium]|nr:type I methionyl aminopeptidase [Phycisphaerales bacterium]
MAIPLKSPAQIDAIAAAGRVLDTVLHDLALRDLQPGVTTRELSERADRLIRARRATPALLGYRQGGAPAFSGAACVCVNEEVVHAAPSSRIVRAGDVVTIDCAIEYKGWHADTAWTVAVDDRSGRASRLQALAAGTLADAAAAIAPGVRWSSIADAARERVAREGCCLLAGYCGHGVGRALHEPPRLSFVSRDWSAPGEDVVLQAGMVLCVEPIICEGTSPPPLAVLDDGWTVVTADRRWTAHEEVCVAVTRTGSRVLAGCAPAMA